MVIAALNKSTVKLITSTQIITSVSSVVKELVENALDADAKNTEINLIDNGLSLIEIRDDGYGISAMDVPNMTMPHYTSKISNFTDLESLTTYGFRGEALNAICRVAGEVTVTTKTIHDQTAKLYTFDGDGNIVNTELSHRFVGTTVRVKKLFEKLPVRRQLITNPRKSRQDVKQIENLLKSLCICNPIVRMSYRVNNNLVFLKPSCANIKEALSHIVGSKITENLEWIYHEDSEIKLELMIPKKQLTDLQIIYEPNEQYIIVNNRPVKYKLFEKIINERISDHFGAKAPVRKHPVCLLNITVPPSEVDVNLEPNKTTVLLRNQDVILKQLDKMLVNFYNLSNENTMPELSICNVSIDGTPEYHDLTRDIVNKDEMPVCKKPKLMNNKQKASEFIIHSNSNSNVKQKDDRWSLNDVVGPEIITSSVMNQSYNTTKTNPPMCKKSKTVSDEIQIKQGKPSDKDMIDRILSTFPGPILSDSDDELNKDTELSKKLEQTSIKVGHAVRSSLNDKQNFTFDQEKISNDSEPFALSPFHQDYDVSKNAESNASNDYCETLSQLPVVDLGEDFDIQEILKKPAAQPNSSAGTSGLSKTSKDNNQSEVDSDGKNMEKSCSTLELWSKGQIPGLKGSTDVSVYDGTENKNKNDSSNTNTKKMDSNSHTIYHTGFSKFSYEIRSQVLEENPGAALPSIGKILANRWKELSPEERNYYRDLALEEKKKTEAEKKRLKNNKLSQQEADKNKARLVQMLESMKKTKSNKKCPLNERTTVPWEITIQSVTKSFFAKPEIEEERIIGPLTDEIWIVKFIGKICIINSTELLKAVDSEDLEEQKVNEGTASILQYYLKEKKTNILPFMHPIEDISSSLI